jgi:hypothetical protein
VTLPVPTLNYYQGNQNQNDWNFKYQPSRYPGGGYFEKFTFPNKEPQAIVAGESDKKIRSDSGKIFFPDEVSDPVKQDKKAYHFSSDSDVRPIWKIRHRPTTSTMGSRMKQKPFNGIREMSSAVDGSTPSNEPKQLPDVTLNNKMFNDIITESEGSGFPRKSVSAKLSKLNQEDRVRVAAAVEEFYDWLRKKGPAKEKLANKSGLETALDKNCQPSGDDDDESGNTTEHHISDQSLVAGLNNQNCPDGQVRLENGECKVKVAV